MRCADAPSSIGVPEQGFTKCLPAAIFPSNMPLKIIGPRPFARDAPGQPAARIGTIFPGAGVLYTKAPEVHAWQRLGFIEHLNAQRAAEKLPPLTPDEEGAITVNSVDLVFETNEILIRPDPERMELACAADELLQELVSKRYVKFLSVSDSRVREAIKRRGECWRLSSIPKNHEAKEALIVGSKVAIRDLPIYYYNSLTGTRWLTSEEFAKLAQLDAPRLAGHLQEIADYVLQRNRLNRPELDFFAVDAGGFGAGEFAGAVYEQLSPEALRAKFDQLRSHFEAAVGEDFRKDNSHNPTWCERMLSTLFLDGNEAQTEQILSGLSPEFFLQIDWLAGGRFEEGEFLLDPIFDEAAAHPEDKELQRLCDPRAKDIIFNFIRDYGDLEVHQPGLPARVPFAGPAAKGRAPGRLPGGVPRAQRARTAQALPAIAEVGGMGTPR